MKVKENKERDKYLEQRKLWNMKVKVILIVITSLGTMTKGLVKEIEDLENRGRADNSIVKIYQNTKSHGYLRRLAVANIWVKANVVVKNSPWAK